MVVADDPSMHSSQNEQDSRFYGDFSMIPILEPHSQQEAYEMTRYGFDLSEKYGLPVMLRITTRLAESHEENAGWGVRVNLLSDEIVGRAGAALWILFGATGIAGSRLARRLPQDKLKKWFGWFLVAMGLYILARTAPAASGMLT